ncbi:MAG: hypothetical protein WC942_06075 [Clostridia bacterium]|jgi:hypothetical protein
METDKANSFLKAGENLFNSFSHLKIVEDEKKSEDSAAIESDVEDKLENTLQVEEEEDKPEEREEKSNTSEVVPESEWGKLIKNLVEEGVLAYEETEEYEDSKSGFEKLIEENIKKKEEEALKKYKESLGDEGKKILEKLEEGYSLDRYIAEVQNTIDYDAMDIAEMSQEDKLTLIGFLYEKQGLDEDVIATQLEAVEKAESVDVMVEKALSKLKDLQIKELENKKIQLQKEQDLEKERKVQAEELFKSNVLSKRELKGINLSENDAKELYDYITKPVGPDKTTAYVKNDSEENRLFYAFLGMKGFDFKKLMDKAERKVGLKFKKALDTKQTVGASNYRGTVVDEKSTYVQSQKDLFAALSAANNK